jgi:putative acetyltransferase
MARQVLVREASGRDLANVLAVERAAFDRDDEPDLVQALLGDPGARPVLSLVAISGDEPVGHILFTRADVICAGQEVSARLLAPLAVVPGLQGRGIGARLIEEGLRRLRADGVDLVFVLGYPDYYGRHGFTPAGARGFEAPYPIPQEHADAWMVADLKGRSVRAVSARVACADALDRPEYWRE